MCNSDVFEAMEGDDMAWFEENYEELKAKYMNKVVAFENKKILAHGFDVDSVIGKLEKLDIDTSDTFIKIIK